jgi:hypothetical protein
VTTLLESARQVVETHQFVCIDAVTGAIVPTPDAVYEGDEVTEMLEEAGIIHPDPVPDNVVLLDAFTAQAVCVVYDALQSDEAREKFQSLTPAHCVAVCWKLLTKESA